MTASRLQDRLRRPWAVWLALCVALLGALAVPLAHAVPRGAPVSLMAVCTSAGTQVLDANGADHPAESAPFLAHCPFCLHATDRLAPPPRWLTHISTALEGLPVSAFRQALFFSRHVMAVPPPRGPPVVS